MPSLIDIRRRIRAVKSTQQITKAMKMVASSKLRRSRERIVAARPFAIQLLNVLNSLASRVNPAAHPLLAYPEQIEILPTLLFIVSGDKGFCGSFNTNVIKSAGGFVAQSAGREVALGLVGRKGRDFFKRRGFAVRFERVNLFAHLKYADAQAIGLVAVDEFTAGRVGSVYLVYNEFKSALTQRVVIERLLPIPRLGEPEATLSTAGAVLAIAGGAEALPAQSIDYVYDPGPAEILNQLLPVHVDFQVYRALLESTAAEHAARMTAMDAATKNAAEMIDGLTLYMNKVRQAAITREIIEVVSGAQAL